jgi:hypothetical protein
VRRAARAVLTLAAAGALVASAGCQVAEGPLQFGRTDDGEAEVCAPAMDRPWLIGDSFTTPDSEVRLDGFELVNAQGMELIDAWLTTEEGALGAVDFPPSIDVDWEHAVAAVGQTIPPDTLQTFAVQVQATADAPGHADAVAITYTTGGQQYRSVGTLAITVADPCSDGP